MQMNKNILALMPVFVFYDHYVDRKYLCAPGICKKKPPKAL